MSSLWNTFSGQKSSQKDAVATSAPAQPPSQPRSTLEPTAFDPSQGQGVEAVLPSRGFTDDLCYGAGVTYLTALGLGGAWGLQEGLRRSVNQPPKLRLNSVLNAVTRRGPFLGNSAGVVAITYNCFNGAIGYFRGKHDAANTIAAGALSGMLFKSTRGLRPMLISGGIVAGVAGAWAVTRRTFFTIPEVNEREHEHATLGPLYNLIFVLWNPNAEIPSSYRLVEKRTLAWIIKVHVARTHMEDVSWKIENLFDEETEIQCLDEWNDYHKCIFPSEVRFLHHLPPMVAVFDREDKIRAFRQKARIPEKAKLAARWRIQNKIAIPTSESWVHRAIDASAMTRTTEPSKKKEGAYHQVHFSDEEDEARASGSASLSNGKQKQKEKEREKDAPSSSGSENTDEKHKSGRDRVGNRNTNTNKTYRPAPIIGANPTHGVSYGTHFSTNPGRSVGPAGYTNFSANLKNPGSNQLPTINQIPLNTNPTHIILDPAMADYQFGGPRPGGPSYQPPVPDTTYGPMTHVYRPRFDNGAYFVHGQNVCNDPSFFVPRTVYPPTGYLVDHPILPNNSPAYYHYYASRPISSPATLPMLEPRWAVVGGGGGPPGAPPPSVLIAGNNPLHLPPDVSGVGRTSGEVALENAQFAYANGLYEPQDFKPADDDPSRYYPVREVDGNWTQRNRYTIDNLGDCRCWARHPWLMQGLALHPKMPEGHCSILDLQISIDSPVGRMLFIGLTGSIATGKSTVSSILSQPPYSIPIIDADLLAREVVEPGTSGYAAIVSHFASSTPDLLVPASETMPARGPDGKGRPLNRPALGRRVFGDTPERRADRAVLNGIVHPAVRWAMYRAILRCYLRGNWAVVLDVPLLFEAGMDRMCGIVTVVAVRDPEVQMARLRARDAHLSEEDARNRVISQGDVREKARRCEARGEGKGLVLWNDGSREELEKQIGEAIEGIKAKSPGWWNLLLLGAPPLAILAGLFSCRNTLTMVKKQRTPTLCEWALGFTVEEIHAQQQRRRQKQAGRSSQERFRVEISTDDESEEDTLKITYPRSSGAKKTDTMVKKVRFEKGPAKSAIKKGSDSEASDAEGSRSKSKTTEDSVKSSDSSKSSKKTSGDKSADEALAKNRKTKKRANLAKGDDSSGSDEETLKNKKKQNGKKDKSNSAVADESEDVSQKKKIKKKGEKSDKDPKTKDQKDKAVVKDNNVGPMSKKDRKAKERKKNGPSSVASSFEKLRPEGFPQPHPRLPNLIMPIRAEVLQVEHTIEGAEDPRPNAYHSGEHGIVRVYHGPAYGNPYGMLYPRRDLTKANLPAGMPHPASNPWQQGFHQPSNPGDMQFSSQAPWNSFPLNSRPGDPQPPFGPDGVRAAPAPTPWVQDTFAGRRGSHGSIKHMSPPFMSGALNGGIPSMTAGDKDRAWDTKTGPPVSAKQVSPSLPININMYSYAARPDPWTKEGRERYANLGKGPGKSKSDIPPGTKDYWDGSLQNNMGPAMYNRDEARQGSTNGSNNSNDRSRAKHQDLSWGPPHMKASADRNGQGKPNWKQTDGNNDIRNGSQNGSNRATWTANNDSSWAGANGGEWAATSNGNGNGNGSNWNPNWDNNTNKHWTTSSNNSKGSKTSNRSAAKPRADDWCDSSNNVGFSSGNSNKSGGSGGSKKSSKSQKSTAAAEDWTNNAGPVGAPGDAAGSGCAWGPTDDWSRGNTGGDDPSSKMPGAWDSTPNKEQNGGFPWGDTTAAQAVPDTQW
ncbi:hypothetical protein BN1708_010359 [Verticillium longisporum]|uniref:Uncharacterized protein n=1 Tax=Verticillium longisporum TaxID=100787 RepID=A0A0G4KQS7_VERLO|nr:hypothetical protein BN1708_010359 [Verticillium longisporum]